MAYLIVFVKAVEIKCMYKIYCQAKKSVTGLNYQFSICFGGFSLYYLYVYVQLFSRLYKFERL